jgi:hypothetical protein
MLRPAEGYEEGEIVTLSKNDAHRLIDGGFAKLFRPEEKAGYVDRMARPEIGWEVAEVTKPLEPESKSPSKLSKP